MKRYLLTLVALLAMTTGAWAQQTTVTWDTETWASGWTSDVKTHTVDGVTITVTGTAEAKNSSGNLYIYVDNSASNTLTFSSDIPIARIEMTKKSPSSSLYLSPKDGWSVSSDNTTVIWEGTATKSLVCKTCTLTVTKIKFFLEEPLIALDDTKTVATMAAMPAYDATVSYELVRDMQEKVEFLGIPTGNGATVKKDGDKYTFATAPIITLSDVLNPSEATTIFYYNDGFSYVESGLTLNVYPMVEMEGFPGYYKTDETATPVALTDFLASPQPGRWKIKATATTGPYDGTLYSPEFTLAEAYDLTLSPATDANLKSVTVAGTAKTADENGVIKNIEPTKKVKITTTGPDYIIRKAAVKKTGAAATALAPALENGATVVIICDWGFETTTFTYTNNGGTFSCQASGFEAIYFNNGLELNGKNLSFGASDVDLPDYLSVGITFNTESSAYSYTGKGSNFVSFTISVNGTDVTDQLSELK